MSETKLREILLHYRDRINEAIPPFVENMGPPSKLREACSYALSAGGKRFRAAIVLMVAEALQPPVEAMEAALAIEAFHTASLVADDLPCMDDDDERRGKKAAHTVYGEATALLVTYALIAAGYHSIGNLARECEEKDPKGQWGSVGILALQNAALNTGLQGATGGQFLDMFAEGAEKEVVLEAIEKKTGTLFEISFVFGWLFGGGDVQRLSEVKSLSHAFGMAFQIADDFDDIEQDRKNGSKANLVLNEGKEAAQEAFCQYIDGYQKGLISLGLEKSHLRFLGAALSAKVEEKLHLA